MKLQCPCGAKYAFDISPEMVQNPVKFVCPTCGLDSSEVVNEMIRREFAAPPPAYVPPVSTPPPAPPTPAPRLKISREEKPVAPATEEAAPVSKYCQKHRGVLATEKCTTCGKPICPQCLELFGFFCSPLCQNKADLQGIAAPVYAGQKFERERQFWRKTGLIAGAIATIIALLVGAWGWYIFYGSRPHPQFSLRFEDNQRGYSGKSQIIGDQLVFLHGATLARHDLKTKKPVWSVELITPAELAAAVKAETEYDSQINSGGGYQHRRGLETIEREVKIALQARLQLHVSGQNLWIAKGRRLTQYDWDTGKPGREVALPELTEGLVEKNGELVSLGAQSVTRISLASGETSVENFPAPSANSVAVASTSKGAATGEPDASALAAQAQNLTLPGRIALPALLSNVRREQQLQAALQDDEAKKSGHTHATNHIPVETFDLIPGATGFVQFSRRLLEHRIVSRVAARAAPKQSALNGEVNVTQTAAVANELLNEMRHNAGGDTVEEDQSRYRVTVQIPGGSISNWSAEVIGPPQLFVLKTVNVIAAGKTVTVLDKSNQKLWSATLTYPFAERESNLAAEPNSPFGEGPCVEHDGTLYVFDEAVLSAFELTTGNARWRVPSVGVMGLFFDDAGFVYVNTTSANPDDIKYARQIDITKHTDDVLLKLDPKDGRTLWNIKPGGFISYLKGKFIYTVQSYDPNPTDEEVMNDMIASLQKPPYLRIARIDPKNGRILWEYFDKRDRCPFDVRFDENRILLLFKREVQVLKFLTF